MTSDAARPDLELLLAEAGWVRSLAHSLVSDAAAADDVVQETWLAVLKRPPRTDQPVRPWLARVVANFARMRRRGEAARAGRELQVARGEATRGADELIERIEVQRELARDVLALAEPFRATIVLRYYEGLSSAEIARRLDAPAATVRWRLMRGLELLRAELDRKHKGERAAWMALLAPLSHPGSAPVAEAALTTAAGAAVFARWLALAFVLALAVISWFAWPRGDSAREELALAPLGEPWAGGAFDAGGAATASERDAVVTEPASHSPPRLVAVRARIVDEHGAPIAGAQFVELAAAVSRSAVADDEGAVELATTPSDTLRAFEARAAGFVSERVEARAAATLTHLGDVVLAPACALEGTVLDADGRALAGARVRVEVIGSRWRGVRELPLEEARYVDALLVDAPLATCDARGAFRVDGLRRGWVRAWASAPGYRTDWSDDLALADGATTRAEPFELALVPESARIAGVVLASDGAPVANAEIECARASLGAAFFRGERFVIAARADEQGRFDFGVDPESHYELAARGAGEIGLAAGIAAGDRELRLRLASPRRFELDVRDERAQRIADFAVRLVQHPHGRELARESDSLALGVVEMPLTDFQIQIDAPGFASRVLGPFVPEQMPAQIACTLANSAALTLRVSAHGAPVEGALVDLLAAPAPGRARVAVDPAFAVLLERGASVIHARTSAEGRAVCDVASAGRFWVRVEAPGFAPTLAGPLELAPGAALTHSVELDGGGSLEGRVIRRDGRDVAGTIVGASCGDGWYATTRVGPDGAFRFDALAPGPWQVRELEREAPDALWSRIDLAGISTNPREVVWNAEVRAGEIARYELVLGATRTPTLKGRLTCDGAAPGAWQVEARGQAGTRAVRATLDPRGEFELSVPQVGRYELKLFRSARGGAEITLTDALDIGPEGASWTLDLACARVLVGIEGDDAQGAIVSLAWRGKGELALDASCELAGARADFGRLPAGSYTIDVAGEGVAAHSVAEVAPGEEVELVLPRDR